MIGGIYLGAKFEDGLYNLCNYSISAPRFFYSLYVNNIMMLFPVVVATLAVLAVHFHHKVVMSNSAKKNYTVEDPADYQSLIFSSSFKESFVNLVGGGGGSNNDGSPPDFWPGRWQLFPWLDFDPLFWYDLQWNQPEKLLLFPKQWYEDEELAFAWSLILANQKKEQVVSEVS